MKSIIFFAAAAFMLASCDDSKSYSIDSDEKYRDSKETIEKREQKTPAAFIRAEADKKKNLIGQTVVSGKIFNDAKMVTYKDVTVKLSFYSKTGAVLEEDVETVYETVHPGGSAKFKSKFFTPKGSDSVGIKVLSAKY